MIPPTTQSGKAVLDSLTLLSKELKFYSEGFKASRKLKATIADIDQIKRGISTATQSTKQLERQFKTTENGLKGVKKITDAIQKMAFKDLGGKWSQYGKFLNAGAALFQAGFTTFLVLKQGEMQGYDIATNKTQNAGIAEAFTRAINNRISINNIRKDIEALRKKLASDIDRVSANTGSASFNARKARELANDALYEVRQGRKVLEARIARLTPDTSAIQKQINDAIGRSRADFQKQVDKIVSDSQKRLDKVAADLQKQAQQQSRIQPASKEEVQRLITEVQKITTTVQKTFEATQSTIKTVVDRAIAPIARVSNAWGITVVPAQITPARITPATTGGVTVTPATITPVQVTPSQFSSSAIGGEVRVFINGELQKSQSRITTLGDLITASNATASAAVRIAQDALNAANTTSDPRIGQLATKITEQEKKLKEQDKVNQEGNRKLDELLRIVPKIDTKISDNVIPTIAGIPLIAGRVIDGLKPSIPTIPQIENATGTAMCRNLRTGCGKQAIDDAVGNLANNSNSNTKAVLDALGTGSDLANLALLPIINNKLGDQLPDGGISGYLKKGFKWLQVDRITNLMTLWVTIHNAGMLSAQIGDTLLSVIENGLTIFGIQDADGSAIDINEILGKQVEGIIKDAIGAENYTEMILQWKRASTIYRSTANVIDRFSGLTNSVINGLEVVGGQNAKIGNALRNYDVVGQTAYEVFNPSPSFKAGGFLDRLNNLDDAANFLLQVSQVPIDIKQANEDLIEANTEFIKTLREETKKGIIIADAEKTKKLEDDAILASLGVDLSDLDKLEAEVE